MMDNNNSISRVSETYLTSIDFLAGLKIGTKLYYNEGVFEKSEMSEYFKTSYVDFSSLTQSLSRSYYEESAHTTVHAFADFSEKLKNLAVRIKDRLAKPISEKKLNKIKEITNELKTKLETLAEQGHARSDETPNLENLIETYKGSQSQSIIVSGIAKFQREIIEVKDKFNDISPLFEIAEKGISERQLIIERNEALLELILFIYNHDEFFRLFFEEQGHPTAYLEFMGSREPESVNCLPRVNDLSIFPENIKIGLQKYENLIDKFLEFKI